MDVIVDGQRDFEVQGEAKDVMSVVGAVTEFLRAKNRAMLSLQVDGKTITPEILLAELEGTPLDEIGTLEVASEDIQVLVEELLRELRENLPELPDACRALAEVFHGEDPTEGYEPFESLAQIWEHVKNQELLAARGLDLDLDAMVIDGVPITKMHEDLNGFLREAAGALENEDTVLLGDLLEYELAPRAEQEAEIVKLLQEQVAAKFG